MCTNVCVIVVYVLVDITSVCPLNSPSNGFIMNFHKLQAAIQTKLNNAACGHSSAQTHSLMVIYATAPPYIHVHMKAHTGTFKLLIIKLTFLSRNQLVSVIKKAQIGFTLLKRTNEKLNNIFKKMFTPSVPSSCLETAGFLCT